MLLIEIKEIFGCPHPEGLNGITLKENFWEGLNGEFKLINEIIEVFWDSFF